MVLHATPRQLAYFYFEWFFQQCLRIFQRNTSREEESVDGKVVVITGSNSGLGKYAADELAKRGAKVVLACRNLVEGEKAREEIVRNSGGKDVDLIQLDLSDLSSVRTCAQTIKEKYPVIDILVNNAGVSLNCPERKFTKDGFEMHLGTNHLGHFLLSNLLLDNIKAAPSGRIVMVSSTAAVMSNLDLDNLMMENVGLGMGNTMPYNNSKFAQFLFHKELAKRLQGTRVRTYAVCPGLARSSIFKNYSPTGRFVVAFGYYTFFLPIDKAADIVLYCCLAKDLPSDRYRFGKRFSSIAPLLKDELSEGLWKKSEELVGLRK